MQNGLARTFLPLPLPPPAPFLLLWEALKPFTSSSRIIEGGLTFLPHPGSGAGSFEGSTSAGGANTTAVDDTTAEAEVVVSAAPTGSRGAAGFAFWAAVRRTGAKASEADHPSE